VLGNVLALVRFGGLVRTATKDVLPMVREARKAMEARRGGTVDGDETSIEEMRARLGQLESRSARQADILARLSLSVEGLEQGLETATKGMRTLLVITVASVVLAMAAMVVAVVV